LLAVANARIQLDQIEDFSLALLVLAGGQMSSSTFAYALNELTRLKGVCFHLEDLRPVVAPMLQRPVFATQDRRSLAGPLRRFSHPLLRAREKFKPWEALARSVERGLSEALVHVMQRCQQYDWDLPSFDAEQRLAMWQAFLNNDGAAFTRALDDSRVDARTRAHDSPFVALVEDGCSLIAGRKPAILEAIAHDAFETEMTLLGAMHAQTQELAQALGEANQPWLAANLALLRGDCQPAYEAQERDPSRDWSVESAWIKILVREESEAIDLLESLLRITPTRAHGGSHYFVRFLLALAKLRHRGTQALGGDALHLRVVSREWDDAFSWWLAAMQDPEFATKELPEQSIRNDTHLNALLRGALRRVATNREMPAVYRESLGARRHALPDGAWGAAELSAVLEGRPSLGFGLGTLRSSESAWREVLKIYDPSASTKQKTGRSKQVQWFLSYDASHSRIDGISFSLSSRSEKTHLPWAYTNSVETWSPHDQRIFAACRKVVTGRQGDAALSTDLVTAILPELVGHPDLVCIGEGQPSAVELKIEPPRLVVEEERTATVMRFEPPLGVGEHIANYEPGMLRVFAHAPEQHKLVQSLGFGLRVPKRAKSELDRILPHLIASAPVAQSTIASARQATDLPADERIHVLLEPFGQDLVARVRVRPIEHGAFYQPCSDPAIATFVFENQLLRAKRSFDEERAKCDELLAMCPTLHALVGSEFDGRTQSLEEALALTLELRAPHEILTVHWPKDKHVRAVARLGPASLNLRADAKNGWFHVDASVQIDETRVIELAELLRQVQKKNSTYVQLDENTFVALTDSLHRRLAELAAIAEIKDDTVRVSGWMAGMLRDDVMPKGEALDLLARQRSLERYVAKVPASLRATLRPYQREGFEWLARMDRWGAGAVLADDMGLGKTVMALALLLHRQRHAREALPALIVVPTSLVANWQREAAQFAPKLNVLTWNRLRKTPDLELRGDDVVLISYGLLTREIETVAQRKWGALIFDEAQALKNPLAKRTQAACAIEADFRVALSGTPVENNLGELWSLFRILNPGLLGSRERFDRRFVGPIERDASPGALERLRKVVGPFMLRRRKEDVLEDLPERIEIIREVHLDRDERTLYEATRLKALQDLQAASTSNVGERKLRVLAELTRLRRLCCHPGLIVAQWEGEGAKLDALMEIINELRESGHRALVFSQFVDVLTRVRQRLAREDVSYQYLDGQTLAAKRQAAVDAFQEGDGDVFLISLKAGGTGLNLTAADYVIILDPWWNPAVEDQASARAHRMGQRKVVTVIRLVCQGTIEEKIIHMHAKKRELAESVLEASANPGKVVDLDAMMDLLHE
jgi:superfamily II DNA or RNA helicase